MFRSDRTPEEIIMVLASFVIAITIPEFMPAYTAHQRGDDPAKRLGRITFNPIEHFDPIGFFGMVMIAMGFPFIGWGKPVPVQPGNFRGRWGANRKVGMLIVAAAGPLSNIAQALVMAIPFQFMWRNNIGNADVLNFLQVFISINILLAAFNMIPIPPLDGYKILTGVLPNFWTPILRPLEQYGFMVLFVFIIIGNQMGGGSVLSAMIDPVYAGLQRIVFVGLV